MFRIRKLASDILDLPPVRAYRSIAFDRFFETANDVQLHRGIYRTFGEAAAAIPKTKPRGYDHPVTAGMYDERLERVYLNDYPVLLWLKTILGETRRVFDFGGHIGIAFHAYARYLDYPSDLTWTVFDVPAVVERGRRIAEERARSQLRFTTDPDSASGADLFLAAGSLQYVDEPLHRVLARLPQRPRHLIVNRIPMRAGEAFFTVQSIGTAFCPYAIFNRGQFLESLRALGYELVDEWMNFDLECNIAFEPGRSVKNYTGMYLRLPAAPST